ncbi:MAG TPA: indolepyruvate ferredoxin oxidoreductase subunit beta [Candidatus Bathyarchaeia archaeon]|nr:indolepyruvate ferredoxin oxidoreductase subunit beta [Candidatus Bathyarchaeia archaeon]
MKTSECDIVVVGVGGQGVILISNIIGKAAMKAGYPARGAETHGMAQRGGSVISHIRLGCEFGPLVPPGGADILLALEPAEALRYGHYLSRDGVALVNTRQVLPTTVTTGQSIYPPLEEILAPLQKICSSVKTLNATKLAAAAGNLQTMNVVMLGALSRYIPLNEELILKALSESIPAKFLEVDKRAFALGKGEVE